MDSEEICNSICALENCTYKCINETNNYICRSHSYLYGNYYLLVC